MPEIVMLGFTPAMIMASIVIADLPPALCRLPSVACLLSPAVRDLARSPVELAGEEDEVVDSGFWSNRRRQTDEQLAEAGWLLYLQNPASTAVLLKGNRWDTNVLLGRYK